MLERVANTFANTLSWSSFYMIFNLSSSKAGDSWLNMWFWMRGLSSSSGSIYSLKTFATLSANVWYRSSSSISVLRILLPSPFVIVLTLLPWERWYSFFAAEINLLLGSGVASFLSAVSITTELALLLVGAFLLALLPLYSATICNSRGYGSRDVNFRGMDFGG